MLILQNENGNISLIWTAVNGYLEMAKCLIEANADVNLPVDH